MLGTLGATFVVLLGGVIAVLVGRWLRDATDPGAITVPERVPFAGGHEPTTHAWARFHVRYYAMAILFLAFDMEMVFMYPWAVVYVREGVTALMEMVMFIVILLIGVFYAWREHALDWQ